MSRREPEIATYGEPSELVVAAGDRLVAAIQAAVELRGRALVVLTGGRNGVAMLHRVADQAATIDWDAVQVFFGDDRFVPFDDLERNEKQAREVLLDHIGIPAVNVHAMPASDGAHGSDIDVAALAYEQVLADCADPGEPAPVFDVHLLGMGPEGHINSLFPKSRAVHEKYRMVVPVLRSPKPPPRRITLTLPAVRRSREVWLIVSGRAKAGAVAAAVGGADPVDVPAAGAVGTERTVWLLDTEAAAEL